MSKAEEFIKARTRTKVNHITESFPWITVDDAKKVVEIAKKEMIEKLRKWIKSHDDRDSYTFGYIDRHFYELLKQAMKDEQGRRKGT